MVLSTFFSFTPGKNTFVGFAPCTSLVRIRVSITFIYSSYNRRVILSGLWTSLALVMCQVSSPLPPPSATCFRFYHACKIIPYALDNIDHEEEKKTRTKQRNRPLLRQQSGPRKQGQKNTGNPPISSFGHARRHQLHSCVV